MFIFWRGGNTLVFQAGYHTCKRTFKTHPKHVFSRYERTLNTHFCMLFFFFPSCPFQNLRTWWKTHSFLQFCTFLHPKMIYAQTLPGPENNSNYVNFLLGWYWYPTSNTSASPPPGLFYFLCCLGIATSRVGILRLPWQFSWKTIKIGKKKKNTYFFQKLAPTIKQTPDLFVAKPAKQFCLG